MERHGFRPFWAETTLLGVTVALGDGDYLQVSRGLDNSVSAAALRGRLEDLGVELTPWPQRTGRRFDYLVTHEDGSGGGEGIGFCPGVPEGVGLRVRFELRPVSLLFDNIFVELDLESAMREQHSGRAGSVDTVPRPT